MTERPDWNAKAKRVAASIVAEATGAPKVGGYDYNALVELVAYAYRRGAEDGLARATEIMEATR